LRYIAAASALAAIAFTLPAAFDGTPRAGDAKAPAASPAGSHRHPPRFEISISYTANLIHWIDNLAGSSQGKTVRAYRQYWQSRFGTPDPGEMELLRSWVILRNKTVTKPEPAILNDRGCLPQREEIPTFRQSFLIRSYEAPGVEEFVASMKDDLSAEEIATLRRTLEKFRPRFDDAWKEASYLPQFEKKLESFLEEGALTAYLGEVASFFGVDPDAFPPSRIELMALPGEGATHAQADGRYLLIEIRPNDTPVEQIQVIAHETSHYLWHLVEPARNDALARRVHATGSGGSVAWNLLREALPTALGQGLADARLAPAQFSETAAWYHVAEIDRLAKDIYPAVAAAFHDGKPLDEGVIDEIARRAEKSLSVIGAAPSAYLADSFFAIGDGLAVPYRRIRERIGARAVRNFAVADPNAIDFVARYECLSGVALLGPVEMKDPSSLPGIFTPPPPRPAPAPAKPADSSAPPRPGEIVAVRRPGGGIVFFLIAPDAADLDEVVPAFLGLTRRPDEPIFFGHGTR